MKPTDEIKRDIAKAIAGVIAQRSVYEEARAKRMKIADMPSAKSKMIEAMWPELTEEANAAYDAAYNARVFA